MNRVRWAHVEAACKAFFNDPDWESRWQFYRALHFKMDMLRALEAAADVKEELAGSGDKS